MKFKTTAKAIREQGGRVVSAGYCDLYHILKGHDPVAYTCGVYGWNFDVYIVDGLTICTGYRGMVGRTANNIREYEERAKALERKYDALPYTTFEAWQAEQENFKAEREALLAEFIKQA